VLVAEAEDEARLLEARAVGQDAPGTLAALRVNVLSELTSQGKEN
jgi:hypothetical protein